VQTVGIKHQCEQYVIMIDILATSTLFFSNTIINPDTKNNRHIMFKFFSKLTVICNCCFIAVLIWRYWQQQQPVQAAKEALRLQPLESTLAVLGYSAVFVNLIFHIWVAILWVLQKHPVVAKWLWLFNVLLFLIQLYFFFF
jgi:hypothetical protein